MQRQQYLCNLNTFCCATRKICSSYVLQNSKENNMQGVQWKTKVSSKLQTKIKRDKRRNTQTRSSNVRFDIARARVANGDSGAAPHEQQRHWRADNCAAAQHHCVFAAQLNVVRREQRHDAHRRARRKRRRSAAQRRQAATKQHQNTSKLGCLTLGRRQESTIQQ